MLDVLLLGRCECSSPTIAYSGIVRQANGSAGLPRSWQLLSDRP